MRARRLRSRLIYVNNRTLNYRYDGLDRLDTIEEAATTATLVNYDYIGRALRILRRSCPVNSTRLTFLDNTGTTVTGYDGLRRIIQVRHLRGDNTLIVGFTHTYDRVTNKLGEAKLHDSANDETYAYDSAYRLLTSTRPNLGAITPEHGTWTLDGAGHWGPVDSETREHSSFNEITVRADGGATALTYDDNGSLTDDGTYTYTWDALHRLRTVTRKSDSMPVASPYNYVNIAPANAVDPLGQYALYPNPKGRQGAAPPSIALALSRTDELLLFDGTGNMQKAGYIDGVNKIYSVRTVLRGKLCCSHSGQKEC